MAQDAMPAPTHSPTDIVKLNGTTPGQLDPTQPDRLLRTPGSTLLFASFDPHTAAPRQVDLQFTKLSINETLYQQKRVVVEISPTGDSHWRFVPKARKDEDVHDEGQWPRIVDICGQHVECSQDQWDIYKLDPLYECRVCAPPALSVITRVTLKSEEPLADANGKRPADYELSQESQDHPKKKIHLDLEDLLEQDDEVEVEDMIIDSNSDEAFNKPRAATMRSRVRQRRTEIIQNRYNRRNKTYIHTEKLDQEEEMPSYSAQQKVESRSPTPDSRGKRKANSLFSAFGDHSSDIPEDQILRNSVNYAQTGGKRTRTVSPSAAKRYLDAKRSGRDKLRSARRTSDAHSTRQQWHAQFMEAIYAEAFTNGDINGHETTMDDMHNDDAPSSPPKPSNESPEPTDEEVARAARITESRRKLAELEADRPLWEEATRQRTTRERVEEEDRRRKAEERRQAELRAEADRLARARAERQAREETLRREREEHARRERDRRQRQQRWSYGPWTVQRALERYRILSEAFDTVKYTEKDPVSFDLVPWPVLSSPISLSIEDVDWAAVEKFFAAVRSHMRPQDYKILVEKSHKRFHPDRWRSRGILKSVIDEAERGCLEVAANTVAQALTPLWIELKGR